MLGGNERELYVSNGEKAIRQMIAAVVIRTRSKKEALGVLLEMNYKIMDCQIVL